MSMLSVTQRIDLHQGPAPEAEAVVEAFPSKPEKKHRWRWVRRLGSQAWSLVAWVRQPKYAPSFKRLLDFVGSIVLLLFCLPLLAVVAVLIKLTDGGPVLFWQTRVGRKGREFPMPKFRSMIPGAEELLSDLLRQNDHKEGVIFKMKADPRVTWIGRLLRRFSIDELPQLWCVLKGEMSLVGPRPPVPREVELYSVNDLRRLDVLPGLTCIWQVSGRSLIPFPRQVEMDLEYIQKQSLWLDLTLLVRTIPAVISNKGAY